MCTFLKKVIYIFYFFCMDTKNVVKDVQFVLPPFGHRYILNIWRGNGTALQHDFFVCHFSHVN
jgi:hypothetical protein